MFIRKATLGVATVFLLAFVSGCGTTSNTPDPGNQVLFVLLSPSTLSLNAGEVVQLTANVRDGFDEPSSATVAYSSSNTALVTVSPGGAVCAGVWNSGFTACSGATASGSAAVTATAKGTASNTVTVIVHPPVTSVVVDPVAGCNSSTLTKQFTAHVCSAQVVPHDSSGPCAPNAAEVTSQAGPLIWQTADANVASVDANGLVTGGQPGVTTVFASVSNVVSAPAPYRTCMPIDIRLHAAGGNATSASMIPGQAVTLQADMTDENGLNRNAVPMAIFSNSPAVASVNGATVTANSVGSVTIGAGCIPPVCGNGFPQPFPVYSNPFHVVIAGASPPTTVFATSSFSPPSGVPPILVPIDTSKNPPVAGTAINLPGLPNSMVFAAGGARAYLGTSAGLAVLDPATQTVTVVAPQVLGQVVAVSPAGDKAMVSDAGLQPDPTQQRFFLFDLPSKTFQTFVKPHGVISPGGLPVGAAFGSDGLRDYVASKDGSGNIFIPSPLLAVQTINIGGTSSSVAALPSGPFVYVANSAGLEVVAACNNVQQPTANNPPTNSSTIQLVQAVPGADVIVALDSSGIDVETVTVKSILSTNPTLPVVLSPANCQPFPFYSNQFLDFGVGPLTGRQLLVASNGSRVVVFAAGTSNVLAAVPGATPSVAAIPLAGGGTEPLSGGITLDGNTVWVGVAGTNTNDKIDLVGGTDAVQVPMSFKKSDGTAAPPDIVAVWPK